MCPWREGGREERGRDGWKERERKARRDRSSKEETEREREGVREGEGEWGRERGSPDTQANKTLA